MVGKLKCGDGCSGVYEDFLKRNFAFIIEETGIDCLTLLELSDLFLLSPLLHTCLYIFSGNTSRMINVIILKNHASINHILKYRQYMFLGFVVEDALGIIVYDSGLRNMTCPVVTLVSQCPLYERTYCCVISYAMHKAPSVYLYLTKI